MPRHREGDWRDRAAAELLLRHLPPEEPEGGALVAGDPRPSVPNALTARGWKVSWWSRRALGGALAAPWPPPGPFSWVALRLPRDKGELEMTLHALASVMAPGGLLLVYGAKDEGVGGVAKRLEPLFRDVAVVAVGGHCRVVGGRLAEGVAGLRGSLGAWREEVQLSGPGGATPWVSYPGVFAHGRLDPGTRLLLEALPSFHRGSRVLDYGCGSGVVGGWLKRKGEEVQLDVLDVDAVALEAARENVPGARFLLRDGLPPPSEGPWDGVVSNPPFHRGKKEDPGMVTSLIRGAREMLVPGGRLVLVAQRRLALAAAFRETFREVSTPVEDPVYRVWEGAGPRLPG